MLELRPYQQDAVDGLLAWWTVHKRHGENPVIVIPTAGGKTIVFSKIIQKFMREYPGTRILVLAHRKELIAQAEDKLLSVWPAAPVGVYAASLKRREIAPITVASRDTLANVVDDVGQFDLIIIDECHNVAPGEETRYRKIIGALKDKNPHLHVIGFSATPYRTGQGYVYGDDDKHLFQGVAYEAHIRPLIDQGYLCPVTAKAVSADAVADTSEIKTTAGDYNQKQLEQVVADENLIAAAVAEWQRLAADRAATVFYCVSVLHAELVSEELHRAGIDAPVINGKTAQGERDTLLTDFDAGKLPAIVNVGVLTEGWDCPRVDCIVILRPTKSLGLYMQMVGRGLRQHPGKRNTLVLDFGGCIDRFGPIDIAQPVTRKKADARTKTCPACDELVGFYKRRCVCGYEFEAQPVKLCPVCDTENAPGAAQCVACDHVFVTHERKAAEGGILSTENRVESFDVEDVTCQTMLSSKTGLPYLKVIYRVSLFEYFYRNLMIGYEGYAGSKAAREWQAMTFPGTPTPTTPAEAMRLAQGDDPVFLPVDSISVDMSSRYKDIVMIDYANTAEACA